MKGALILSLCKERIRFLGFNSDASLYHSVELGTFGLTQIPNFPGHWDRLLTLRGILR